MGLNQSVSLNIFVILMLTLSVQIQACKETAAPTPPDDNYSERAQYAIVLEAGSSGGIDVLKVQADGNNMKLIPSPDIESTWPLVSPNGQYVSFRTGTDFRSLYQYTFSSGQGEQILSDLNWDEYAWAPTNDKIVFDGEKTGGGYAVKIVDIPSGVVTNITDSLEGNQRYPHWLPDGKTIAFVQYDSVNTVRTLYSFDLPSRQFRKLVVGQKEVAWSSDNSLFFSNKIVYSWPDLVIVRDLSSMTTGDELFGRWFPNNRLLLIQTGVPDEGLYRVNVLTGVAQKIISGPITFKALSISQDGALIAFVPGGIDNNRFVVADSNGQKQQSITVPIVGANYRRIQFIGDVAW